MQFSIKKLCKVVLAAACLASVHSQAQIQFPDAEVIGVVGASFAEGCPPEGSLLAGVCLAGDSFEGLGKKLIKNYAVNAHGLKVSTVAHAGANSFDVPAEDFKGSAAQTQFLMQRTSWFDGITRLKYALFSITNDCLHNRGTQSGEPCTDQDVEDSVQRIKDAVTTLRDAGVVVLVNAYPAYELLDLETSRDAFGLAWVADETQYNAIADAHRDALSGMQGVAYIYPWANNFQTFDGLHPTDSTLNAAAAHIGFVISLNELFGLYE